MSSNPVHLAITLGDPLGIGPEIVEKALRETCSEKLRLHVYGDAEHSFSTHQVTCQKEQWDPSSAGKASLAFLEAAMEDFSLGKIDGIVTAPISKTHISLSGFAFPGHTEYLAHKTKTQDFLMMMASPTLKVTLVTIHVALAQVSSLISQDKVVRTLRLTHEGLKRDFGIRHPKIAVCGLNPHGGEGGKFGREELEFIVPAIAKCQAQGISCVGPEVPDAVFHRRQNWDAIVCMYHDQGLIPFKMLHFHEGVNVTLGLPVVRTSPDHGTAFDIAGKGIANPTSMVCAIRLAECIVQNRRINDKN